MACRVLADRSMTVERGLWEQGLPAMNDHAVHLENRGAFIASKLCSHRFNARLPQV
ncbi:hypothetical protein CFII68_09983 [Pseudomonas sp. CFII68]|nr:hypothetical protein CFII68_09983 [Pseudomonas sp. CFII68]